MLVRVLSLAIFLTPLVSSEEVDLAIASVAQHKFCVGYRTMAWTKHRFSPSSEKIYKVQHCSESTSNVGGAQYRVEATGHVVATLVDSSCDVTNLTLERHIFVKSPFPKSLTEKLNGSYFSGVMQVRGDVKSALLKNDTVVVRPLEFGRIYWGAIIMYFFALIYVSTCAVLVEAGRQLTERHAASSPLEKLPFTQTRSFLITFLILFMFIICLAFGGYFLRPIMFQPFFALFLTSLAVVGFYHAVFPVIVYLADRYIRIVNKTYWMVERISVIMGGIVIFGLWMKYRTVQNIWPLQLLMMGCVGIVPIRYAPLNCILKCLVLIIIGVLFSMVQRYVIPAISPTTPSTFVDIVTIQARIPDTISPGPLFYPDDREASMLSFRIPIFGEGAPCSNVLDGTFGMTGLLLPAMFIKAAMLTDNRIDNENFLLKNYTAAVLSYLLCHIAVFVWSFVAETPVNSNIVYLPGITLGLTLNSIRMGQLRTAFFPPSSDPPEERTSPPMNLTVYKVTASDQI